jgi:hypothetical protein
MQLIALVWGILAMLAAFIAFFPCLGFLNWLVIPFAVTGLVVSGVAYGGARGGSRRGAQAGLLLCGVATVLGAIRLAIGGGVF